jgi:hypothetical protein
MIKLLKIFVFTLIMIGSQPVNAELQGRLPTTSNGTDYQAYYDTVLNVTWLKDANLAASNQFGMDSFTGIDYAIGDNGAMTWNAVNNWVSMVNQSNYLGFNSWRLPTMGRILENGLPTSNFDVGGCTNAVFDGTSNCGWNVLTTNPQDDIDATLKPTLNVNSEIASLYFDTLNNTSNRDTSGNIIKSSGLLEFSEPFVNIQHGNTPDRYWIGLLDSTNSNNAWTFAFGPGLQQLVLRTSQNQRLYAMLVVDGDVSLMVSSVPEPSSFLMMIMGLISIVIFSRKFNGKVS